MNGSKMEPFCYFFADFLQIKSKIFKNLDRVFVCKQFQGKIAEENLNKTVLKKT